ncbi:hypothetical protein [Microbacterium sp. 22242]|uniref:hypothetical protein n=1 Tax=Microbacterium sp. 22242 TaxID=3453896 RepID=UPI003F87632C
MPKTTSTPGQRLAAVYPLIDVDPDFHIPARRESRVVRLLRAAFGRPRPAAG